MADFTATFEAGVDGANVTTGAGEASATAWNGINFTAPKYSNVSPAHGSLKCLVATDGNSLMTWNLTATDHYGRFYYSLPSAPSNQSLAMTVLLGGTGLAKIYVRTDRKLRIEDTTTALDTTAVVPTGQWVRIEYHVIHSTTVGQIEMKYFETADSTSVTETLTSPATWNTGAGPDGIRFGALSGGSWQPSLDDIVANATSYPGPAVSAATSTLFYVTA